MSVKNMEVEEDMIVLVVVEEEEKSTSIEPQIKTEPVCSSESSLEVDNLLETAEKHGEYLPIKIEPCDYIEDEALEQVLQSELNHDDTDRFDNSQEYSTEYDIYSPDYDKHGQVNVLGAEKNSKKQRFTMLKPSEQKSFVAELRREYPELRENKELLINTLEEIMRTAKPPPPPKDYYIMTGIMFECIQCGAMKESIPAASRHYQEKHGPRYLLCYACGVDFRSATNLYKHEKRCSAPDAHVVLRARAAFLGRKGRSRPYLQPRAVDTQKIKRFPCRLCSAVFRGAGSLAAHLNLHRGQRPFRCHQCPCAYTSYSALSRHSRKHLDIEYICDHCNRSFKIKAALVSHMETHKPTRRFACGECSRRFAQKSALQLHVHRVHRCLPPPCACPVCPKRYPRMSLLKAHMKREHGLSIITRKMFLKSLPTMTEIEIKQSKVVLKSEEDGLKSAAIQDIQYEECTSAEDVGERDITYEHETSTQDIEHLEETSSQQYEEYTNAQHMGESEIKYKHDTSTQDIDLEETSSQQYEEYTNAQHMGESEIKHKHDTGTQDIEYLEETSPQQYEEYTNAQPMGESEIKHEHDTSTEDIEYLEETSLQDVDEKDLKYDEQNSTEHSSYYNTEPPKCRKLAERIYKLIKKSMGSNVIYMKNGKVVPGLVIDDGGDNLMQVEALVEGSEEGLNDLSADEDTA